MTLVFSWIQERLKLRSLSTISKSTTRTTFRWSWEKLVVRLTASQTTIGEEKTFFQQTSSSRTAASVRQRPLASCWVSLECKKPKIAGVNVTKNFEVLKQYESAKEKLKLPVSTHRFRPDYLDLHLIWKQTCCPWQRGLKTSAQIAKASQAVYKMDLVTTSIRRIWAGQDCSKNNGHPPQA